MISRSFVRTLPPPQSTASSSSSCRNEVTTKATEEESTDNVINSTATSLTLLWTACKRWVHQASACNTQPAELLCRPQGENKLSRLSCRNNFKLVKFLWVWKCREIAKKNKIMALQQCGTTVQVRPSSHSMCSLYNNNYCCPYSVL